MTAIFHKAFAAVRAPDGASGLAADCPRSRDVADAPLDRLLPAGLSMLSRIGMIVLRDYVVVAARPVLLRIFRLAMVGA